jgi:hypothetical protein
MWVTQVRLNRKVVSKALNGEIGAAKCIAWWQAVLAFKPGDSSHRAENLRSVKEYKFINEAGAQARPVDNRSAFHEETGDPFGAQHAKYAIQIRTTVMWLLFAAWKHGFNLYLLHVDATLFQGTPLVFLGERAEDNDIVLCSFHYTRGQWQA